MQLERKYNLNKLKVTKVFNLEPCFDMYVIGFVRADRKTRAITISEDNKLSNWDIEDLEVDFENAINL